MMLKKWNKILLDPVDGVLWSSMTWLVMVPIAIGLYYLLVVVPHFVGQPNIDEIKNHFLNGAKSACLPEPVEQLRYVLAISFVPFMFFIWSIFSEKVMKNVNFAQPWMQYAIFYFAIATQALLIYWISSKISYEEYFSIEVLKFCRRTARSLVLGLAFVLIVKELYPEIVILYGKVQNIKINRFSNLSYFVAGLVLALLFRKAALFIVLGVIILYCIIRFYPRMNRMYGQVQQIISSRFCKLFSFIAGFVLCLIYLIPSVFFDSNLSLTSAHVYGHMEHVIGEFAATWSGKTMLVDFFPQYNYLAPYIVSPVFDLFGFTTGSFTLLMSSLSLGGLLIVFYLFRKMTGSYVPALFFFVPFLSISFYGQAITPLIIHNVFNYYAVWPLRFIGPLIGLFFLSKVLENPTPKRTGLLFFLGALIAINNLDFGLPSLVGMFVAIWFSKGKQSFVSLRHTGETVLLFLLSSVLAMVFFIVFSSLRSGAFPQIQLLVEYQRIFAVSGFMMLPAPFPGLYWIFYLTYMGCLILAVFRTFQRDASDEILRYKDGILAYSAIFGCGSLMYYIGRSHPQVLIALFAPWALCLLLLLIETLQHCKKMFVMRNYAALLFLIIPFYFLSFNFMVYISNLVQIPSLPNQSKRFMYPVGGDLLLQRRNNMEDFIKHHVVNGEKVVIAMDRGDILANKLGIHNIFPFPLTTSIILNKQVELLVDKIEENRINKVFLNHFADGEIKESLKTHGFNFKDQVNIGANPGSTEMLELWVRGSIINID